MIRGLSLSLWVYLIVSRQEKTRHKASQNMRRRDKTRQHNTKQDKATQHNTRQEKIRQDNDNDYDNDNDDGNENCNGNDNTIIMTITMTNSPSLMSLPLHILFDFPFSKPCLAFLCVQRLAIIAATQLHNQHTTQGSTTPLHKPKDNTRSQNNYTRQHEMNSTNQNTAFVRFLGKHACTRVLLL